MLQYFDTLTDNSGNALLGATVAVTQFPSGAAATIYSANGTASPIANATVASDITGQISFYAPDGVYILTYSYKGTQYKVRSPVQMLDPTGFVALPDSGGANAYVVTDQRLSGQLYTGLKIEFKAAVSNTGASTLNVNGTGAQPITQPGGGALVSGMIQTNGLIRAEWDGTQWQFLGVQSQPFFALTPIEISKSLPVTNFGYPSGWAPRYGTANDNVRLQATLDSGAVAFWPDAAYSLGTVPLVIPSNVTIQANSIGGVQVTYTGTGTAITASGKSNITIFPGFTLFTTDPAANGVSLTGSMRHIRLGSLLIYGDTSAANTGTAFLLGGGAPGQAYSGSLHVTLLNTLGYKFGIKSVGTDGNATWTTMTFEQCLINGRSAGIIAGSKGIWFDALTNAVGSICLAGAIQSFAVPVQFDNGTQGMDINLDMEGNTTNTPVFGASVVAMYTNASVGGDEYKQRAFAGAAVYRRLIQTGRLFQETKFGPKIIVTDVSNSSEDICIYRGSSALDGGSPTIVGGVTVSTSNDLLAPERNWMYAPNGINKIAWGTAKPTAASWHEGDILWRTTVTATTSPGWVCTTSGTGTLSVWGTMANLT